MLVSTSANQQLHIEIKLHRTGASRPSRLDIFDILTEVGHSGFQEEKNTHHASLNAATHCFTCFTETRCVQQSSHHMQESSSIVTLRIVR